MAILDEIESLFAQGEISSEDLLLAAYLGDSAAAEMMGGSPGADLDLSTWIEGIGERGAYPLMSLCIQLSSRCLKTASEQVRGLNDALPQDTASRFPFKAAKRCLRVAEDYLEQPGHDERQLQDAGDSASSAAENARKASFLVDDSETARTLSRAASAFEVLEHTLAVFLWTPSSSTEQGEPWQSTYRAMQAAMNVLDLSEAGMRKLIRDVLIPWREG